MNLILGIISVICLFVLGIYNIFAYFLLFAEGWVTPWYFDLTLITVFFLIGASALTEKRLKKLFYGFFAIATIAFINKALSLIILNTIGVFILNIRSSLVPVEQLAAVTLILAPLITLSCLAIIAAYIKNIEDFDEIEDTLIDFTPLDMEKLFNKEKEEVANYDVVICNDKKTKKPITLKFKDRFLHTLILGATGTGKSSQVLLPMINQDLQKPDLGLTIIDPKGDLVETATKLSKYQGRDVIYFNPTLPSCPYFNPLFGPEDDAIEDITTTFRMLNSDSATYFQDLNEVVLRNSLKVLKRIHGNNCNFLHLNELIHNTNGNGIVTINKFARLQTDNPSIRKENDDIASWFLNEYFKENSKIYENANGLRQQISKLTSNAYLRKILNPPDDYEPEMNFGKHLEEGGVICINAAQGTLRALSRYLGYFIILQFQSSVFRRPGDENTRKPHILYIDEFQEFANSGFTQMLTQGRSYRCASVLATLNRSLIATGGGRDGKHFMESVSTNARNIILFPGANPEDASYYSKRFGEIEKQNKTVSKGKSTKSTSENVSIREELKPRFTPSDITFRPFGEIIYSIIKDGTVELPRVGAVNWLPKELLEKTNQISIYPSNNQETNDTNPLIDKKPSKNEDMSTVSGDEPPKGKILNTNVQGNNPDTERSDDVFVPESSSKEAPNENNKQNNEPKEKAQKNENYTENNETNQSSDSSNTQGVVIVENNEDEEDEILS